MRESFKAKIFGLQEFFFLFKPESHSFLLDKHDYKVSFALNSTQRKICYFEEMLKIAFKNLLFPQI